MNSLTKDQEESEETQYFITSVIKEPLFGSDLLFPKSWGKVNKSYQIKMKFNSQLISASEAMSNFNLWFFSQTMVFLIKASFYNKMLYCEVKAGINEEGG